MTSTTEIIKAMLTENTGVHFLDSGGDDNRMWQRNQGVDFDSQSKYRAEFSIYPIDGTLQVDTSVNLYHWMNDNLHDPPHLLKAGPKSWLAAKYGKLSENWREDLRQGFSECWRVLEPNGVLIFKWNETQVKVREVLELAPAPPLFGHLSGRKGLTHWLVFMKE